MTHWMTHWLALLLLLPHTALAQGRIDIPSRPGVIQPVYLTPAAKPTATVVLFPGGTGVVAAVRNNFLLRVGPSMAQQGFTVAVADTPSDQPGGMGWQFRLGPDHAKDIAAIVDMLKARSPAPIWLIGTSRGSISAANGAAAIDPPRLAGVVLTSSVWNRGMGTIAAETIRLPVLIVHNQDDGCTESPFSGAEVFSARLVQAPARQLIAVSGGTLRGDPCQALSPHGYYGIEDQVVPAIIAWIRAH